jgi:exodeoxyribonuclease X
VRDLLGPAPLIRVLDLEATGLERGAAVVEYGWTDIDPATLEIGETCTSLCRVEAMPCEARAVHHIRAADTAGFPPYDRRWLYEQAVRDCVYSWAAHTADFEAQFILGALPLFCTYKAALRLWPDAPSHSVFGLLYWLEDLGVDEFDRGRAYPAHRAGPDSYATAVLLRAMLAAGLDGRRLRQWTCEPALLPRCPIGDYRGQPWEECDAGFLEWILRKIWDREDVRFCAELELEKRRPML